ncbi:MAG TPA: MBL fold metallo-hydrolase [Vicinamibacteria bacterium]|nr:MBL fold metallo-hydrolase [Vicinamibacteria bacterium]
MSARVALPFFWRRLRASARPRPGAAPLVPFDPRSLERSPAAAWIGHATFYVRLDGAGFLTDPIYSERASPLAFAGPRRLVPPGVPLAALPRVDFALLTHDHYDHSDLPTIRELAGRGVAFVVPSGLAALVSGAGGRVAAELGWWQATELLGLRVTCVPTRHFSGRGLRDRNRTLWCGFVVASRSGRVYHAGDSALFAGFAEVRRRLGPVDLALLPIGAYEPRAMMHPIHLNPEEAARAASDVDARLTVGMHWGTFDLADEPLDEPPRRFLAEAARRGLQRRTRVMAVGETLAL